MHLTITIAGDIHLVARMEEERCPLTCEAIAGLLPFTGRIIHVRWSGEAVWVPLGGTPWAGAVSSYESPTSHPAPGELLFHPGGLSEPELLLPYGPTAFSSRVGSLAGNPFLTVIDGAHQLAEIGRRALWEGSQTIRIEISTSTSMINGRAVL
jgi:hypothetical protein